MKDSPQQSAAISRLLDAEGGLKERLRVEDEAQEVSMDNDRIIAVAINPGSGPVDGATVENAWKNMEKLLADCDLRFDDTPDSYQIRREEGGDAGGRFRFYVYSPGETFHVSVDMPGLPIERVRYMGEHDQNPWNFPRLYVDGSSWLWCYACGSLCEGLGRGEVEGRG